MTAPLDSASARRFRWIALIVLTGINLLNYIDRYIFSALLPAIQKDLKFTDTELGMLGSAFILTYLFIAPVFGFFGDRKGRPRIMAAGVAVWSAATAFSGITTTYLGQMATRAFVGLGESAYSVIAPSAIADYFGKSSRGRVFAIYAGAIPVGSALGYVIGGALEPRIGWQKAFFVVGIPGIILAAILFFMPDPPRGQQEAEGVDPEDKNLPLVEVYKSLFKNGGFMFTVLGYAAYTFVVGGMAFWMPTYIVRYFPVTLEEGNLVFGGVTVVGGFVGTLVGGWWADWIERRSGNGYLKVSAWSMVVVVPLFFLMLRMTDFKQFAIALFFMEVVLFLSISPLDAAVLSYVRPGLRATAMALNVFLIHFLGDGISRALMGKISDGSDLRTAIALLPWVLLLAGVLWFIGYVFYWQAVAWPEKGLKIPRWQSHRGFRPEASIKENTLEAFRRARKEGAEMFECDVHLSKDDQAVVFHDIDLKRMAGRDELVEDLSASELLNIAGAPRLVDVLKDPDVPRLANIELKSLGVFDFRGFEAAVVRAVREAGAEDRVMFSSFNPFALRRLAKLAPEIPRALLVTDEKEAGNRFHLRKMLLGFYSRPHMLNLDHRMVNEEAMTKWRDRGIPISVWTVNDRQRGESLLAIGVKSVISDRWLKDS